MSEVPSSPSDPVVINGEDEEAMEVGIEEAKGILSYGSPGCGKTLIAKAAASEAGANFIHVKVPELLSKYVGESEQAIRTLFNRARTCSPCIIFFDEVGALGTQRGKEGGWVVERLVNQFLTELDGAANRKDVCVIGATNRPDTMDPALLRPARFGSHLYALPSPEDRGLILQVLEVDLSAMGQKKACESFTGADLAQLMKDAGMKALAEARKMKYPKDTLITIKMSHFEKVLAKMDPSVSEKVSSDSKFDSESEKVSSDSELDSESESGSDTENRCSSSVSSRKDSNELSRKSHDKITFNDLGGMREVLKELKEMVLFPLYNPELAQRGGVKPTSGILLCGPSGCGKTMLAHAIANEIKAPLHKTGATEIISGYVGAAEQNIRALFKKAYRTAPSVVFIDEIDVIASKREDAEHEMDRSIVSQLMTCMDEFHKPTQHVKTESESFHQRRDYVLVIGATNRPDAIDPALRRPGRFGREIKLGVPDEAARMEILQLLTRRCTLEGSPDLLQIAQATPGFVGADLNELVDHAGTFAMLRVTKERESKLSEQTEKWWEVPCSPEEIEKFAVTMADFEEAAKTVNPSTKREGFSTVPDVKWEDIGGLESIREVFDLEVVGRIKDPDMYKEVGIDEATGILLYGPPGCGKTLIAKAAASEAGVNFIYVKGPELLNKYFGESERAIRTLFNRARTCSPCIIFFDEVDALGTQRGGREDGWFVDSLVNQLLTELDGAADRKDVFVIGATNRPDIMDPALLRPGRFGHHLYVPVPSPEERGLILKVLARRKSIDPEVDLSAVAQMKACENFTGADLAQLMKHAGMEALAEARKMKYSKGTRITIKMSHFEKVLAKMVPSVSKKQIQFFKTWADRF